MSQPFRRVFCNLGRSKWKRSITVCKTTTCFDTTENILPTNQNLSLDWVRKSNSRFCSIQFFLEIQFCLIAKLRQNHSLQRVRSTIVLKILKQVRFIMVLIRQLNLTKCIIYAPTMISLHSTHYHTHSKGGFCNFQWIPFYPKVIIIHQTYYPFN